MTRDEIRGLIGGYATGSLSEAERKTLFEAALDDQELFDELAREQALKVLLDAPGVKTRLIGALTRRRKNAWWANAWVWAATGAFAVAVITGVALFEKPREVQIAQVTAPPEAPEPRVPPPANPTPAAPPPVVPRQAAPVAPASTPFKKAAPEADAVAELSPEPESPKKEPAPAAAPAAPIVPAASGNLGAASVASPAARGGGGGGRGGAVGGANPAIARSFAAQAAKPAGFSFDYSVTPDGLLRITPAAPGFLTVAVNNSAAATVLFSGRPVQAGSMTEIMLPPDAVSATIILEATSPSAQAKEADISNAIATGATDPPSGTKSDPSPSPNSRLIAVIPVNSRR
jgi:hypothetical protein